MKIGIASLLFVAGVVFWGGFNTAMEATNTLEFCISCHEMESTVYQEYQHSAHFSNPSGVQAVCSDCHVPKEWTAKLIRKVKASKELYYWLTGAIDTPEKFEARRLALAERVWDSMKQTDSRECRNCHHFSVMDLGGQARFARRIHGNSMEEGQTCIDCHRGLTHRLPREVLNSVDAPELSRDDREYGEEINDTCAGCHGEYGQGSLDGEYPRLAGMTPEYITRQIEHFKSRQRLNLPMLPYATDRELPGDDIEVIASYLASIELPTNLPPVDEDAPGFNAFERLQDSKKVLNIARYPGNIDSGERLYAQECASCHGVLGQGDRQRVVPLLAGQHSVYLKRQVGRFRDDERLHDDPADAAIFRAFSDTEINDILAWLSIVDDGSVDLGQTNFGLNRR